jgi:hypothetical protein
MGGVPASPFPDSLFAALLAKRKIFISFHHGHDQPYYELLTTIFANAYDVIQDNSLDRTIDSDDPEYVMQRIREKYITGSSATVVLCGLETPWRKYVDWEIKATLDKQHGLIGVNLPNNPRNASGRFTVPDRLHDNIQAGYALWHQWSDLRLGPTYVKAHIEEANGRPRRLIKNDRPMRRRNGP